MGRKKRITANQKLSLFVLIFFLFTPFAWPKSTQRQAITDYLDYYSARQNLEETRWDWQDVNKSDLHHKIHTEAIKEARLDYKKYQEELKEREARPQRKRREVVRKTLDEVTFQINTGYMFVHGEHTFRLPHPDPAYGGNLSKLTYPIRGGMATVDAELRFMPRLSIGGRYAHSNFRNKTSRDEDWNFGWMTANWDGEEDTKWIEHQITEQDTKNEAYFWNANLYYRLFDWEKKELNKRLADFLQIDSLKIDAFAGYYYYQAKHTAIDPMTKYLIKADSQWWIPKDDPPPYYDGLNSPYEVTYKGPRIGIRIDGSLTEKFSSSLSLAYAWVKSNANAYWNLRDFTWYHDGKGRGSAFNIDFETKYNLTSNWFLAGGVHYLWQQQKKSRYSGYYGPESADPGYSFVYEARDTRTKLLGFSLQAGYRW